MRHKDAPKFILKRKEDFQIKQIIKQNQPKINML